MHVLWLALPMEGVRVVVGGGCGLHLSAFSILFILCS